MILIDVLKALTSKKRPLILGLAAGAGGELPSLARRWLLADAVCALFIAEKLGVSPPAVSPAPTAAASLGRCGDTGADDTRPLIEVRQVNPGSVAEAEDPARRGG